MIDNFDFDFLSYMTYCARPPPLARHAMIFEDINRSYPCLCLFLGVGVKLQGLLKEYDVSKKNKALY